MYTIHEITFKDSGRMEEVQDNSVDLIVSSPPYPMIEIWDPIFTTLNNEIERALNNRKGKKAFNLMHEELNRVWKEVSRVLEPGGICCINIGDATRKVGNTFQMFPNHVKITDFFVNNDFIQLPSIIWRKPTNSPTKFLGSGMIPPNAYVTLEHEHILVFRKTYNKRKFKPKSKQRYQSAYFWEERNNWFSDVWIDVMGAEQNLRNNSSNIRERLAAFPFKIPYRLINMFSIYGDTVLDPFFGSGTTSVAAMVTARNSIGYEINHEFKKIFDSRLDGIQKFADLINEKRIKEHKNFLKKYIEANKEPQYQSYHYKFDVITKQEKEILFYSIKNLKIQDKQYKIQHIPYKI